MRHRFTVEIDDDAWVGATGGETAVSRPEVMSIEVIDGDRDAFFELINPLLQWSPPARRDDAPDGPYGLEAVIGRVWRTAAGFHTHNEFVVRQPDGTAGLWWNGPPWREPVPNLRALADVVEDELGQFWSDAHTQELDMRADPDPPPVFWFGLDEASRAALAR